MLKPIKIRISKKTYVPRRPEKVRKGYTHRADFPVVGIIEYDESHKIFKAISDSGPLVTDGHFAKMLLDNYGAGEYVCLAWLKGKIGFWNFIHLVCFEDGRFRRVQRKMSYDEKHARENITEIRRLKSKISDEESSQDIKEEIGALTEELEFNKYLGSIDRDKRRGPYPYLKSLQPVYKEHFYDEIPLEEPRTTEEIAAETMRWI